MQYPGAKWKTLTPLTGGEPIGRFKFDIEPHKLLSLSFQDDALKAYFAASPAAMSYVTMGH